MSPGMWGLMWSEYAFDHAGSFVWEKGAGGTVDLGQRYTKGKCFRCQYDDQCRLRVVYHAPLYHRIAPEDLLVYSMGLE